MTETPVLRIETIRGIDYEVRACGSLNCADGKSRDVTMPPEFRTGNCYRCHGLGVEYRRISV